MANEDDLTKHGIFQFETLKNALTMFRGFIPHELVVVWDNETQNDDDFMAELTEYLPFMGNRLLIITNQVNSFLSRPMVNFATAKPEEIEKIINENEKNTVLYPPLLRSLWLKKIKSIQDFPRLVIYPELDCKDQGFMKWISFRDFLADKRLISNREKERHVCLYPKPELWQRNPVFPIYENGIHFDRHSTLINEKIDETDTELGSYITDVSCPPSLYYEAWDINSALHLVLSNLSDSIHGMIELYLNLMETGLFSILIIDERLAEHCFIEKTIRQTNKELFKWLAAMKIFCITHIMGEPLTPNVKKEAFGLTFENGKVFFRRNGKEGREVNQENIDFIIMHQGIPENEIIYSHMVKHLGIGKKKKHNGKEKLSEVVKKLQENCRFVVIDSGRGITDTIPDEVKFMPFSTLQGALLRKQPSKYHIMTKLLRLTRRKRIWK